MENREEFSLSPWEKIRSRMNSLFLAARTGVAFSRDSYSESTTPAAVARWKLSLDPMAQAEVKNLTASYGASAWIPFVSLSAFKKNIETLYLLESMLLGNKAVETKLGELTSLIDAGTQDFARLPALAKFFREAAPEIKLTGIELDAYPPLAVGHSRFDIAQHYLRNIEGAAYLAENFFQWNQTTDIITAFYPFVSPHPALAWGLPKKFGDASAWVTAIARSLSSGGLALMVHQGAWEEREFDLARARMGDPLAIIRREVLESTLLASPHPAHATLYQRK